MLRHTFNTSVHRLKQRCLHARCQVVQGKRGEASCGAERAAERKPGPWRHFKVHLQEPADVVGRASHSRSLLKLVLFRDHASTTRRSSRRCGLQYLLNCERHEVEKCAERTRHGGCRGVQVLHAAWRACNSLGRRELGLGDGERSHNILCCRQLRLGHTKALTAT